jgi:hypothetical protein
MNETVNSVVVFLFGALLGALNMIFVSAEGALEGKQKEQRKRRPGEGFLAWMDRSSSEDTVELWSLLRSTPALRVVLLLELALGGFFYLVVAFSPVGFRWLPFLGGVASGGAVLYGVYVIARQGKLKPQRRTGFLDRLIEPRRSP